MTADGGTGVAGQPHAREDRSLPLPELPLLEDPSAEIREYAHLAAA